MLPSTAWERKNNFSHKNTAGRHKFIIQPILLADFFQKSTQPCVQASLTTINYVKTKKKQNKPKWSSASTVRTHLTPCHLSGSIVSKIQPFILLI